LPLPEPIIDQSSCQALCCVFRSAKLRYRGNSVSIVREVDQDGPIIATKARSNDVLNAFVDHGVARPTGRLESARNRRAPALTRQNKPNLWLRAVNPVPDTGRLSRSSACHRTKRRAQGFRMSPTDGARTAHLHPSDRREDSDRSRARCQRVLWEAVSGQSGRRRRCSGK
jgi:hypothetical protein